MKLYSQAERPELLERRDELGDTWHEFMYHDAIANDTGIASTTSTPTSSCGSSTTMTSCSRSRTPSPIPFGPDELPDDGWDAALGQAFEGRPAKAVSAIAITIGVDQRGKGLSKTMLDGMRKAVAARGLSDLVAPVRPSLKHRYPLAPIERYVEWRREDGKLLDPWLRVHENAGAKLIRVAQESMRISGTVAEWEDWTKLVFPESGTYVVPGRSSRSRSTASATRACTSSPTSGCTTGSRRAGGRVPGPLDEAVTQQRIDRLAIQGLEQPRLGRDLPKQQRPPLAERALEAGLLAERLVAAPARRASPGERADFAARHAGETHGRAEIEERLQRVRAKGVPGALLNPRDVRVDRQHRLPERLVADRARGVGTDAREVGEILRPALFGDHARRGAG